MSMRQLSERSPKRLARLVALSFKVPFEFRHWFKEQALQRDLTMTEFLILAARTYVAGTLVNNSEERKNVSDGSVNTEIRK